MDATFRTSYPHNTLWRKFRRRYLFDAWGWAVGAALALIPPVCMVAWLWQAQGWGWLAQITRWLWFLESLFIFFIAALLWLTRPLFSSYVEKQDSPFLDYRWFRVALIVSGGAAIALLWGKIELAIILTFGMDAIGLLASRKASYWRRMLPRALLNIAIASAFFIRATWLLVVAWLVAGLIKPLLKPRLRDAIEQRHTRAEYVERLQRQCASGHG